MKKRILVYGMTDNPGGIETYLMNVMQKLDEHNVKFDFVCDFPNIAYADLISKYGSKVYFIPAKSKGLLKHWKELYKVLKQHKEYRTVYFNILDAGAAFTLVIPWILRRKIVTHSHNGETDKKKLHKYCKSALVLMTSQYLTCSEIASKFMFGSSKRVQDKVIVIPNAIDVEKYKYSENIRIQKRKELNIPDDKVVIGHVGRLSIQKNPFGMLDIFKETLKKDKNVILLSIGTGELEAEVKEYASRIGVEEQVKFMGKRADVAELFQAMDVFFLPSFYEGLPIVALEAQAAGLSCVLSNNITKEVNITGNVSFVDLDATFEEWSNELLKHARLERNNVKEIWKTSEYNLENFEYEIKKIEKCLLEKNN